MATIIDALLVTLGLDATGFKQGQKDAADAQKKIREDSEKTAKKLKEGAKGAIDVYKKLRNELIALAGAYMSTSGIKSFVENITHSDSALGLLSKNLDIGVETLSKWELAAERLGSSKQDILDTFQTVVSWSQKLNSMYAGEIPFTALGVAFQKANVDMKAFLDPATKVEDKLKILSDVFSHMTGPEALLYGEKAGFSDQTITMLRKGRAEIDSTLASVKNLAVNTRDTEAAHERNTAILNFTERVERFGRDLATTLTPNLDAVLDRMSKWIDANKAWLETGIIKGVKDLAGWIHTLTDDLGGPQQAFAILGGMLVGGKVGGVYGAIAGGVAGYGINQYSKGKEGIFGNYFAPGPGIQYSDPWRQKQDPWRDRSSSTEININGPTHIHTMATDANGIAVEWSGAIKRHAQNVPANSGLR